MGLYDYTIYSVIKRNARIYRSRVAWISGFQKVTYQQYLERVDRLSCGLLKEGIEKGDRIGVLGQNSLEFFYLYGATAKIGAIMLPINWRLKPEEVEYIISDGSPKIIFFGSEFQDMLMPLMLKFDFVERYYSIGQGGGNFAAFDDLMENDLGYPELDVTSGDPYIIIHTAAVGGRPRGAILSQRNLVASNLRAMSSLGLSTKDSNLTMLPLFHIAEIGNSLSIMQAGGLNIILPKFDVGIALKHIQEDKVTIFTEFSPMLKNLLDKAQEEKCDLSSLRIVMGLDNPNTIKRFEEMTGAIFWTGYGQSETTGIVSLAPFSDQPGSAGLPGFMAEIEIMDDYGNIVESGKPGEIVIRGPMVFNGYWNLEKENEYTFRDAWHHTGDIGHFESDGYLWYECRKAEKELIKTGGENVYPSEVEKVILEHPMIEEVSVIGIPDKQWREAIKAVCVLKKQGSLSETDLIEFVSARIARYKKPKYVVFASSLPKMEDGLVDRKKVKADYS